MRGAFVASLCLVACNEDLIDPADSGVLDVTRDVPGEVSTGSLTVTTTTSPTGLSARVCWTGELDRTTLSARFGDVAATPTYDGDCFDLAADLPSGKHSLNVSATIDGAAHSAWIPLWVEPTPFDWRTSLLYMVMVDRFADSDGSASPELGVDPIANYQGGDFGGIQAAIEDGYFAALGVDALWVTPVLDNADGSFVGIDNVHTYSGYHGYWPISASNIEDRFGGAEAFDAFVRSAHDHGIRVVLDTVLNHVHEDHDYCVQRPAMCRQTCVCGTSGCDWEARALDCQFASYLPDLDYRDPLTLTRVVDDLMQFVASHDLDGLRLDAVKHMDTAVITAIRARTDALAAAGGAPFWLIGETFTSASQRELIASFIGPDLLDGQFDFPLFWTIRDAFVHDRSFRDLEAALRDSESAYGDALALMSPFLGNHDVERIATALAKNDQGPWGSTADLVADNTTDTPTRWDIINPLTMAMAFTLTLRGVPLLYQGDEVGLAGSGDPDNRRMLPRQLNADRAEILRRVQELGNARRAHPVIALGERRELWQDDDIYVQGRWMSDANSVIIAMNKGDTRTVTITVPAEIAASGARFSSLLSDRTFTANGDQLELALGAWEYLLLVRYP